MAVLLMVLAHVVDSWTRDADRDRTLFYWAMFLGGLAGPAFLFLAGVGTALSGAARQRAGASRGQAVRALVRRGWVILGLAFVFRLQALALGWGSPWDLLKVDILNVMGLSLVAAALLWSAAESVGGRVAVAALATFAVAMTTPLIRASGWVEALPGPLEWYWRPSPGRSHFTLTPFGAFVFAGVGAGVLITRATSEPVQRRLHAGLAAAALGIGALGWWASFQPTIYPPGLSTFWDASPTLFFIRLAVVMTILPLMWALRGVLPVWLAAPLGTLGEASLFAYWVHVEVVYGGITIPIHRRVPLELSLVATAAVAAALVWLVPRARRWVAAAETRPVRLKRLVARLL